jgi:hypothetical protein
MAYEEEKRLTKEQVLKIVDGKYKEGELFGFKVIGWFYELSSGWYEMEDIECKYCLHCVVSSYGTLDEKRQFNNSGILKLIGKRYLIPTNKKEAALINRQNWKRHREYLLDEWHIYDPKGPFGHKSNTWCNKVYNKVHRVTNNNHQELLKWLRYSGVPILRRTKRNIDQDLIRIWFDLYTYAYIKGIKLDKNKKYCVKACNSESDVLDCINSTLKRQGLKTLTSLQEVIFIKY